MKNILRGYFFRLFKTKSFWVEFIILGALGLLAGVIFLLLSFVIDGGNTLTISRLIIVALNGGYWYKIATSPEIPAILILVFVAVRFRQEVTSGSFRDYIVTGHSRGQIYVSLYLGNLVFAAILRLVFAVMMILPITLCRFEGGFDSAESLNKFFLSAGLGLLAQIVYFTFIYSTCVLLNGNGFVAPMNILIFVGTAVIGVFIYMIPLLANMGSDTDLIVGLSKFIAWLPPTQRAMIGSADFASLASPSALSGIYELSSSIPDQTAYNMTSTIVELLLVGGGSFFGGYGIFVNRDLK